MEKRNIVFIAKSLDGFIADKEGALDWLTSVPNPDQVDMGYSKLISRVDAIVMGRNTFELVCSFDIGWPYHLPVFVLSNSLGKVPQAYNDKAEVVKGSLQDILRQLNARGYNQLYIDGGLTIQSFLKEDLIDELIITTIPILLGGGTPLFSDLPEPIAFKHIESAVYLDEIVQDIYIRKR